VARVVIVDDNLLCRTLLRRILSDGGHEVVGEAQDGTRAPVCVHELRPDLVTLDLVMPGRGGLATLEHLLMVDPSLAVVVCSASLDQRRVLAALRLGAKGFVVKPVDHETVLDAVRNALAEPDSRENEGESDEMFATLQTRAAERLMSSPIGPPLPVLRVRPLSSSAARSRDAPDPAIAITSAR
jgi:two-component system, chemotaxis family, chemotaxis protein CheY